MRILITGGNGYIARNLKRLFENKGYIILAPSHQELDVTNLKLLHEYVEINNPDAIIHAAIKGGKRTQKDTYEDFASNITMFENIMKIIDNRPTIIYGSGAEFDRRKEIKSELEDIVLDSWPIDLYGLAKNIITRRIIMKEKGNVHILRLFGCFNHDEYNDRFIKSSILNVKQGNPIIIHENKEMDFFYMDDLFTVTEYIITNSSPIYDKDLNLVYYKKYTLLKIADLIVKNMKSCNPIIKLQSRDYGKSYSGNGEKLLNKNLPLIGLEEGIIQTIKSLL